MSRRPSFLRRWWVTLAGGLLLIAPAVFLLIAGVAWLWQQGWLLWWLIAAAAASAIAWGGLRARHRPLRGTAAGAAAEPLTEPDPGWSPHEQAAWEEVRRLSGEADVAMLEDRREMLGAARRTIEAVARHYHPEHADPTLEFTLPEFLLLSERVSARLRILLLEHMPYSHRLKAGHLLRAWGYKPLVARALEHGRSIYSVVRVVRGVSPLSAVAAELRDYLVSDLYDSFQAHMRSKIVRLWIEEVGRAAIDLYSGRLKVDAAELAVAAAAERGAPPGAPLALPGEPRLLVAGQTNAGKSTLVNALLGELRAGVDALPLTAEFQAYELSRDGEPAACLIDSPGIDTEARLAALIDRAFACDMIVWAVPAHRADRRLDREALDALRARFAADPQRKMPPLVIVASHVDRLTPAREWSPPYDVAAPESAKARSIREALDAVAADLAVPVETIVPMRLDGAEPYNLDLLGMRLTALFDDAKRARWIRIQREAAAQQDWRRTLKQLAGAGRVVGEIARRP